MIFNELPDVELQKFFLHFVNFWACFGGGIVKDLVLFGLLLLVCVVYATTKRGRKIAIRGRGVGCVAWRGRGGACGVGGAWVRGKKPEKIRGKAKKINPPYRKKTGSPVASHSVRAIYYPNTLYI